MSRVCVLGLGYVGLPLACLAVNKGHGVVGFDINKSKIDSLERGVCYVEDVVDVFDSVKGDLVVSSDSSVIADVEVVVVCVPTPVDGFKNPDLGPLRGASTLISKHLSEGQLVIVESTVAPGTVERVVQPILESSGLKAGVDFFLAFCPERINPGSKWSLSEIPRVVGALSDDGLDCAVGFYESIIDAEVLPVSCIKVAEASKILENSFRDVNIAFVNEMAQSFDKFGLNVSEVIRAASSKPFGFMPFYPGAGVGGHCIAVDPYYLIKEAELQGFDHRFLKLARDINNSMPVYVVDQVQSFIDNLGSGHVLVLGLAFKGDVNDDRESPALRVLSELKYRDIGFEVFDPFIPDKSTVESIEAGLSKCDYVLLVTDHSKFKELDCNEFKKNNIRAVVDGRNCLSKKEIEGLGIKYKGVGR